MQGGIASAKNIGPALKVGGQVSATAVAAGAGDNTETDGAAIERLESGGPQRYDSGKFVCPVKATLAEGETCTVTTTLQESADGSSWADLDADLQPDPLVLTGEAGGSTEEGLIDHDLDKLGQRKAQLRAQVHVDLSAAGADVAHYAGCFVLAGAAKLSVA